MLLTLTWLIVLIQGDCLGLVQPVYEQKWWNFLKHSCPSNHGFVTGNVPTSCIDLDELAYEELDQNLRCPIRLPFPPDAVLASNMKPTARLRPKPNIWVHIHKSAGSTICATALANGEKNIEPMQNCNWNPYDVCWPKEGIENPSCALRKASFAHQQATWGQIEREINFADLCPKHFTYGIMLRDPIQLAQSHFNFEIAKGVAEVNDYLIALECAEQGGDICDKGKSDWWMFFDNWLTRKLAGAEANHLPPTNVTLKLVETAKQRLERYFSVITILEHEEETVQILSDSYGWNMKLKHLNSKPEVIEFSKQDLARMKPIMKYDYMIYDFFRSLPPGVRSVRF